MTPAEQERFKAATRVVMAGDFNNNLYGEWKILCTREFHAHDRSTLLRLVEEVENEPEDPYRGSLLHRQYFQALKLFFIKATEGKAAICFDELIHQIEQNPNPDPATQRLYADALCNRAQCFSLQLNPQAEELLARAIELGSLAALVTRAFLFAQSGHDYGDERWARITQDPQFSSLLSRAIHRGYYYEAVYRGYFCLGGTGPRYFQKNPAVRAFDIFIADCEILLRVNPGYGEIYYQRLQRAYCAAVNEEEVAKLLLELMWDRLLKNAAMTPQTEALFAKYPHLIVKKMRKLTDLKVLKEIMHPETGVIRRILKLQSRYGLFRTAHHAAKKHVERVEMLMLRFAIDIHARFPLLDGRLIPAFFGFDLIQPPAVADERAIEPQVVAPAPGV